MLVLGVDPGSIRTGYGLVLRRGSRLSCVASGVVAADADAPLSQRLHCIYDGVRAVIAEHEPSAMAVEDVFSKHPRSALKLGQARGVVLLAGAQAGLDVAAYAPAVVKRSIAGRGAASKQQLARIVGAILGLRELPAVDASDALAIAITHANAAVYRGA